MPVAPGLEAEFINAGHLLGSAFVRMRRSDGNGGTILFGGDLGRYDRPVLPDPSPGVACDVLLVESTYGDRDASAEDDGAQLARIVNETAERGGKLIIPAFAIGRVEEVLYWLKKLEESDRVPVLPVYVDSPMAVQALRVLPPACARAGPGRPAGARRGVGVRHRALRARGVAPASRNRSSIVRVRHRHLGQRHGHRRPRAAPPGRGAARPATTPCCSSASRRTARAAAPDRRRSRRSRCSASSSR